MDSAGIAWDTALLSPSCPSLLFLLPPQPFSPLTASSGVSLFLPCAVLLQFWFPVLLCADCSSACQGWVPVCFLCASFHGLPPLLSFVLPACCVFPCLFSAFVVFSRFPVVCSGWLSSFLPSFPPTPSFVRVTACVFKKPRSQSWFDRIIHMPIPL